MLQTGLGQGKKDGRFYGLDLQMAGLFLEEALNAHADGVLNGHVFRQFLVVLEIELANETFHHPIDVGTYFTLFEDKLTFLEFHRHQDALQHVQLIVSHRTVASGQFSCDIACCQSNCCHFLI